MMMNLVVTKKIVLRLKMEHLNFFKYHIENFKIVRMVYLELVFKGLMNKAIVDNKQTTGYLYYQYENIPLYMTPCDSNIAKFILEWRNVVILIEACGIVLTDKLKIMWRVFELCKDTYYVEYMGRNQDPHK